MADVIERNTGAVNRAGTYKDPQSGQSLEVKMEAGADALVRLGWVFQYGVDEAPKTQEAQKSSASNNEE